MIKSVMRWNELIDGCSAFCEMGQLAFEGPSQAPSTGLHPKMCS